MIPNQWYVVLSSPQVRAKPVGVARMEISVYGQTPVVMVLAQ
jgi:hypothetical protein